MLRYCFTEFYWREHASSQADQDLRLRYLPARTGIPPRVVFLLNGRQVGVLNNAAGEYLPDEESALALLARMCKRDESLSWQRSPEWNGVRPLPEIDLPKGEDDDELDPELHELS